MNDMASRNALRIGLVVLSAAVLQVGLFSQISIVGVRGMVLLLLAVAGGTALGPDRGAIVGFISGLAFDLLLVTPLGLCALVFSLAGWVAGRYQASVTRSSRWRLMASTGLGSGAAYLVLVGLGWLLGQKNMLTPRLPIVVAVVSLINALLGPVAVRVLHWAWDDPRARRVGVGYGL